MGEHCEASLVFLFLPVPFTGILSLWRLWQLEFDDETMSNLDILYGGKKPYLEEPFVFRHQLIVVVIVVERSLVDIVVLQGNMRTAAPPSQRVIWSGTVGIRQPV